MLRTLVLLFLASSWQGTHNHPGSQPGHRHSESEASIAMLENPGRDAYQKPAEVIAALQFEPGERVVDIGAGSGYFSFRIAESVGPGGEVVAVDINPDMIRHLNRQISRMKLRNVSTILADPDDPLLPDRPVDRVFICNTWHHISNRGAYLEILSGHLRRDGEIVMIDFEKRPLTVGPPVSMKISREELIDEMERNGFRLSREHSFLPYQYFMVFVRQSR